MVRVRVGGTQNEIWNMKPNIRSIENQQIQHPEFKNVFLEDKKKLKN